LGGRSPAVGSAESREAAAQEARGVAADLCRRFAAQRGFLGTRFPWACAQDYNVPPLGVGAEAA